MARRRTATSDLDSELAQLEREVAAATGSPVPDAPRGTAPERARGGRLERAQNSTRSLFRKLAAVAILIVAAAILLRIVVGVLAGIVWIVVAILAVVALLWAWRQLR